MIDPARTRDELLARIGATRHSPAPRALDDRSFDAEDARLIVRGHTRDELFPALEVVLSRRFAEVPREELLRDLLVPLRSALGNAWTHGNREDAAKTIAVEATLTPSGALLCVRDEGDGFDAAAALRRLRDGHRYFDHLGAGLRRFERARSTVTWENEGRELVLLFAPASRAARSTVASPPLDLDVAPRADAAPVGDPAWRRVTDPEWIAARFEEELPELRDGAARLDSVGCSAVPGSDLVRFALRVVTAGRSRTRVLTGRLHLDRAAAAHDFEAATALEGAVTIERVRVARPVVRLASEPRLVLFDFHPWMRFEEYLADRDDLSVLVRRAERIGKALALVHRSRDPSAAGEEPSLPSATSGPAAGARRWLTAHGGAGELARRRRIDAMRARLDAAWSAVVDRRPCLLHGAFGFDSVGYGVDGVFYVHRLERCRRGPPELDLAGFLADLLLWTSSRGDDALYPRGRDALLAGYASRVPGLSPGDLRPRVVEALLDRGSSLDPANPVLAEVILSGCERVLDEV